MWISAETAPKDREIAICYEAGRGLTAANAIWSDKHQSWLRDGTGPMIDEIVAWADLPEAA